MAAANAAARERALAAPPIEPDEPEDDVEPVREPVRERPPLVTGTAFARRSRGRRPSSTTRMTRTAATVRPAGTRPRAAPLAVTVVVVVCAAIAALLLRTFVVAPYFIPSASMEPTLHGCAGCNNDHVLVNKLSYRLHGIHRGDVVVFKRPRTWNVTDKVLIKRVIGLPGDVLTTRNGIVYVDGLQLVGALPGLQLHERHGGPAGEVGHGPGRRGLRDG